MFDPALVLQGQGQESVEGTAKGTFHKVHFKIEVTSLARQSTSSHQDSRPDYPSYQVRPILVFPQCCTTLDERSRHNLQPLNAFACMNPAENDHTLLWALHKHRYVSRQQSREFISTRRRDVIDGSPRLC